MSNFAHRLQIPKFCTFLALSLKIKNLHVLVLVLYCLRTIKIDFTQVIGKRKSKTKL
jgi:hypothetical protein